MPKQASHVKLSERQQEALVQITRRHRSEQQQVLRARIVLAAAQGHSNAQIAHELAINVDTARLWRDRWVERQGLDQETLSIAERLQVVRLHFTHLAVDSKPSAHLAQDEKPSAGRMH